MIIEKVANYFSIMTVFSLKGTQSDQKLCIFLVSIESLIAS